jgi:Xrn1 helical domain
VTTTGCVASHSLIMPALITDEPSENRAASALTSLQAASEQLLLSCAALIVPSCLQTTRGGQHVFSARCAQIQSVVGYYIEGLHWVMDYYYRGVPSWSWYYPFHYAPFLSDLVDLETIGAEIKQAAPVQPFQQVRLHSQPPAASVWPTCACLLPATVWCPAACDTGRRRCSVANVAGSRQGLYFSSLLRIVT